MKALSIRYRFQPAEELKVVTIVVVNVQWTGDVEICD
jgi:hypothetical protein